MKIIQANKFYFLKGGAERYMLQLSAWLEAQGHEVIPFAMKHPQNLPTPFSAYFPSFVHTERLSGPVGSLRAFGRQLYSLEAKRKMGRLISEEHPDLAHVHNVYTQLSPSILRALKERGVPIVMTVHDHHLVSPQYNVWADGHGPDVRGKSLAAATASRFHKGSALMSFAQTASFKLHQLRRMYRDTVGTYLCPSDYIRRQLLKGGFDDARIRVVPYGIDADPGATAAGKGKYFLFVGRLSEEKGADLVLRLARLMPDVAFKLAGIGPEETRLREMARNLRNVEFLGFQTEDELRGRYREAIALLLPSRVHEIFPLVILEAMREGTPVIASHVGGIPEIVDDRRTGFLARPLELSAWAEAAVRLAHDAGLRQEMGERALDDVRTRFRLDAHYDAVMKAYDDALKNEKTRL